MDKKTIDSKDQDFPELTVKKSPKTKALENAPEEVLAKAIRDAMSKDRNKH
ncbi:hypothetical protein SAMN04487884_112100 [Butyrivibrio fibrisolvens]|uniref:Uncharacterized protein n=1 Tax=Butyrivibrio fibrisolvens TaxID=831 RepID=A0A1H9SLT6_BUTFI|nr:hypothetical protein [Butyrivibrio fibrisolvens]SER85911.1 hypothetical protein SAMN04487884_112100 [Butyrivibrio fibrisolvens]